MLVHKQDVVLEASIEMRLETKINDDGVVVAVDMSIYPIKPLKNLENEWLKRLREWNA